MIHAGNAPRAVLNWLQRSRMRELGTDPDAQQDALPPGVTPKPPVTRELLEADTEFDPEGAERLVEIVRRLRSQSLPVEKA